MNQLVCSSNCCQLRIRARISESRYVNELCGEPLSLPFTLQLMLLTLVRYRLKRSTGYVNRSELPCIGHGLHQAICRLRKAIDDVAGEGTGALLIEHGGFSTYRLQIDPDQIEIDKHLTELTPDHFPNDLIDDLLS